MTPEAAKARLWDTANKHGISDNEVVRILDDLAGHRAFLYLSPEQDGFVIVRPHGHVAGELWIDFAWSDNGQAIAQYMPRILLCARHFDCDQVAFSTKRRGYHRVMPKFGFRYTRSDNGTYQWRYG
ncbi:hypothetical protein [Pseudoalteromonas rubra]|uniref:hypothetical protein n=1 Tax=Pseudoalteromonas rubra TaxID=43658 RepID=UPI002DC03502|nr:hypothetical protein [Pseudoalteromonas rubra]MEC4091579.1 hypothetical protein [Pseudoalteromonas rubra]